MKDVSFLESVHETTSKDHIVNKIQDILWDNVFEQYFLHQKVIPNFIIVK